ncbi:FG-GAP-like repeat-containing protein [Candidatus Undinarchaeota archaeon]
MQRKRVLTLGALLIALLLLLPAALTTTLNFSYGAGPDIKISSLAIPPVTPLTTADITAIVNVTNGNGTNGLGTWDVNLTLWETTPGEANITKWSNTAVTLLGGLYSVAIGDIDGDGDNDIVSGDSSYRVSILENTGTTDITQWSKTDVLGGSYVFSVAIGDIDGDGDNDLVSGDLNSLITIWNNPGTTDITQWSKTSATAGGQIFSVAIGDMDGDGDNDIVCTHLTTLTLWNNTGTSDITQWSKTTAPLPGNGLSMAIGDIDGDGDNDIVTGDHTWKVTLWNNTGTMNLTQWTSTYAGLQGRTISLAIGDIDGDGDNDIVSGDNSNRVSIWNNTGTIDITQWSKTHALASGASATSLNVDSLAIGDIDGDGDNDIVSGDYTHITLWNNTGTIHIGLWSKTEVISTQGIVMSLAIGDIDGDGDNDIVSGDYNKKIRFWNNSEVTSTLIDSDVQSFTNALGEEKTFNLQWTPASEGNYTITAVADINGRYAEILENNNRQVILVSILSLSLADEELCTVDVDCASGICGEDYDGDRFCAPDSTNCVTNETGSVAILPPATYSTLQVVDGDGYYICRDGEWDREICTQNSDCLSNSCRYDYDGDKLCAQDSISCVTNENGTVEQVASQGLFDNNTTDPDSTGHRCNNGWWSEDPFGDNNTFSQIIFSVPGSDTSTSIKLPANATVTAASLDISSSLVIGEPSRFTTLNGSAADDKFGISVASAGDVNNDSYSDVIVGAMYANAPNSNSGQTYLFYGSSSGIPSLSAANANATINGSVADDYFGNSVASAGDVNNDGYSDVIVGAKDADPASETNSGLVYIFYGSSSGIPSMLATDANVTLNGWDDGDYFGTSVASAGDVNNDGYDDVIVGAPNADVVSGIDTNGKAYIFYGSSSGIPSMSAADANVTLSGIITSGHLGNSVASAGDVNNDGYDDIIVGARFADQTYLFYGSPSGILSMSAADANATINGIAANDGLGASVASAGDVNNDGYSDIIVGANGADQVYLFYGSPSGIPSLSAADANATFTGSTIDNHFGTSVASAGDVNNDGYSDVIAGDVGADPPGLGNAGQAYLFYGSSSGISSVSVADANATINGIAGSDLFGNSVASAGDVNNDGYDDVIGGAYYADAPYSNSGQVYIYSAVHNPSNPTGDIGNNGTLDWSHTGEYLESESPETISFASGLTALAATCSPNPDGYCQIPINISSEHAGILTLSNLKIAYLLLGDDVCGPGEDGYNSPADCCKDGGGCPPGCTESNDNDCATSEPESSGDGDDGDSSGSSSSSFGGISAPPEIREARLFFENLQAGVQSFKEISMRYIEITKFTITTKNNLENVTFQIKSLKEKPTIPDAQGDVLRYFEINPQNITNSDINSIKLDFKTSKNWIASNQIDESEITLQHYKNSWQSLPTSKLKEDINNLYYTSETNSLSYFVISGIESSSNQIIPTIQKPTRNMLFDIQANINIPPHINILEPFEAKIKILNNGFAPAENLTVSIIPPKHGAATADQKIKVIDLIDSTALKFQIVTPAYAKEEEHEMTVVVSHNGQPVLTETKKFKVQVPDFLVAPEPDLLSEQNDKLRIYIVVNNPELNYQTLGVEYNLNAGKNSVITDYVQPTVEDGAYITYKDYDLAAPLTAKTFQLQATLFSAGSKVDESQYDVDLTGRDPIKASSLVGFTLMVFLLFIPLLTLGLYGYMKATTKKCSICKKEGMLYNCDFCGKTVCYNCSNSYKGETICKACLDASKKSAKTPISKD